MTNSYVSTEGSPCAMSGAENETLTKSWRDMTEADWAALKEKGIKAVQSQADHAEQKSWRDMSEADFEQYRQSARATREGKPMDTQVPEEERANTDISLVPA